MPFRKARFTSRPMRAAILMSAVSAVAPLGAGAPTASAQSTPIYGGVTFDQTTGDGYQNASFSNAIGVALNDSGVAIGFADRYVGGINRGTRAVLLNSTTAFELTGLVADPTVLANSSAYSINAAGQVVGFANKQVGGVDLGDRAVRWDPAGNPFELGDLGVNAAGVTNSYAYGINSAGQSVGLAEKYVAGAYMGDLPVRWDAATGAALELGNLGLNSSGQAFGVAYTINASSQAAGQMSKYDGNQYKGERAVAWNADGAALELANLGLSNQQTYNFAYAINNSGQIAGYANKFSSGNKGDRAVRWDAATGAAVELATLGDSGGTTYAYGFAINDAGQVAGRSFKYDAGVYRGERAVRWNADGSALELAHLGLDATLTTSASAFSINSVGQTAGRSKLYVSGVDQGDRAVYWNADGSIVDLNTLISPNSGWLLTRARAISDSGWITGFGMFDPDGPIGALAAYQRHFLLSIAPENNWINPAGGDWETGGNWSSNFAPGAAVDAVFNLNSVGGYTVSLSGAAEANNLIVRTDQVTLNLAGQTLTLNGLLVGRDSGDVAHLTVTGGTLSAPSITVNDNSALHYDSGTINTASVQLNGNALMKLASGADKTLKVDSLSIAGTSKLDLVDNKLTEEDSKFNVELKFNHIDDFDQIGRASCRERV